jgi:predicted N-formylglutamate amidohydrolase
MRLGPPAVSEVNPAGASRLVLVCEHASNHIPDEYAGLGLPPEELLRHIAWDIGAAPLARRLSALLDAPLFLAGGSRLLIDCNRPLDVPSSIPEVSEATMIPGNQGLDAAERDRRAARWFHPFHRRIAAALDARSAAGRPTTMLAIHSFTPRYLGVARPWQVGILYGTAERFGGALVRALRAEAGLTVGDNEPYRVNALEDYTAPVHGDRRGVDAALVEVRQDLLGDDAGVAQWATRLAAVLRPHGALQPG